ncbi:MAG TPA: hypothetical protein VMR77_03685 [Patescibacteria group bacterium]|nr:hypothetical protein [Patescibacteria group bacterium]
MNDNKSINVMKISDYNTTGLYGDEEDRNGAYYKLMRISGSSNKARGMGGTYGLGKGAYFRPSLFRTIFVSSIWGNNQPVFQGKFRLVSHLQEDQMKHGIGLFTYPAIRKDEDIPEVFKRDEKGTSIFIIGFEENYQWQKKMVESVLRYFWLAILKGLLEVKIGELCIDDSNVEAKIFEYFSEDRTADKDNPIPFYRAYKEGTVISGHLKTIGPVELRILLQKDFPRRIEYFRNTGMVIQNKPLNSGKGFAGVFVCPDENEVLRKMEDPTHSRWSKDVPMTSDPEEKKIYSEAEKELKEFVESKLNEITASVDSIESTIKDLDKYFYSPAEDNEMNDEGSPESIEGQIVREETGSLLRGDNLIGKPPVINIQVKIPTVVPGEPEGEGEGGGHGGGQGEGTGTGHPEDEGTKLIKINKNIRFKRSYAVKKDNNTEHIVFISGDAGNSFNVEVRVGTEDSFDTIDLKEAIAENGNKYQVEGNLIKNLVIPESKQMKVKLFFKIPGKYSLNLRAYEN